MNDIDRKIQEALRREGAGEMPTEEPNVAEEVVAAFRGRRRSVAALALLAQGAAVAGAVWTAVNFHSAADTAAQLRWGGLTLVCILAIAMIKIWFWLEMQSNRVLRELKRVELLLISRARS